jgi:hypothetical protein
MASEVTICNLALGHIGDSATVSSLYPPEGSPQAEHCARLYPLARNTMLEMSPWGFAMRRSTLAQVDNPSSQWLYAYAMPSNVVNVLSVLANDAPDDYEGQFGPVSSLPYPPGFIALPQGGYYTPQPYDLETDADGQQIILTNVANALLRYTVIVTDTTRFSPLFTTALSYLLASMLAGPIIKGDAGAAEAKRCYALFQVFESQAEASDSNQRWITAQPVTPWIAGR